MRAAILVSGLLALGFFPAPAGSALGADGEGGDKPQVLVVEKPEDVPDRVQGEIKHYLASCPKGAKIQVTLRHFVDMGHSSSTNKLEPYIAGIVPLDADGKPHGTEELREARSRTPVQTVEYEHGIKDGVERVYLDQDGKRFLQTEIPWKDGEVEGMRKTFYPDGKVRSETGYHKGVADGPTRTYGKDGQAVREGTMKEGLREGPLTDYFPGTKQPKRVIPYHEGKVHGVAREYYASGQLKHERAFQEDTLHGVEKEYEADGKVIRTRYWLKGESVSEDAFKKTQ